MKQDLYSTMLLMLKQMDVQGDINKCLEIERALTAFFEDDQNYFAFEKSLTMLQTYLLSTLSALQEAKQSNAKLINELHEYLLTAGMQHLQ